MEQDPKDYLDGITANERKAKAREELERRQRINDKLLIDLKDDLSFRDYNNVSYRYERNRRKMAELRNTLSTPDDFFKVGRPFWYNWFKRK